MRTIFLSHKGRHNKLNKKMISLTRKMFGLGFLFITILTTVSICEDIQTTPTTITEIVSTSESTDEKITSFTVLEETTAASTAKPITPTVTADICNMSLITSVEGTEDIVMKKCTCNGMNSDVDCSNLDITDLPQLLSFPKDIHIANFEGNKISSLNKETFYNGRGITELDFSYNRIDFISVHAFKAFQNLKRLDLSHNRLWNLPSNLFQGLTNLRRLDMSFNDLINVFPELFSNLIELRELILESNPLEELVPKHFEHLEHLETLNLESTLLSVIPDHVFVFTPKLKFLNLAGNRLTEVPTDALRDLNRAKVLDLSGNPIEVIEKESFRGMKSLVILYLDRMPRLKKIEKYALGDMVQLQEFHCSYNFLLTEIDGLAFVRRVDNEKVPLSQLFLRQDALTVVPKSLLDWNDEVEMHLRDNPLSCDCNAEWMVNTKLKNNFQTQAKCATPSDLEGMALSELKDAGLTCGLHMSEIVMIACAVVTAFLILALIVAFLLWRRNYAGYARPHYTGRKYINDIVYAGGDDGI